MSVKDQLEKLAEFTATPYPVISLYLNTQPGQTGRDQFHTFVRKEFAARGRTYAGDSPERESLERDVERIRKFLDTELDPAANGIALFACSAADLFEAVQLTVPINHHSLFIGDRPHLYPLARLESLYPHYAALLADTNSARILLFATGQVVGREEVRGIKTKRHAQGGWSQARFQRHIENFHQHHAKEVVEALDRIVSRENINHIVISGDEVIIPLLREQMTKHLAEKIVDELHIDTNSPIDDVIRASLEAMKRARSQTEQEKVEEAIGAYRGGGLGTVGPEETLDALEKGQVDELLITARARELHTVNPAVAAGAIGTKGRLSEPLVEQVMAGEAAEAAPEAVRLADELIAKATQTAARITFVEKSDQLTTVGGVAALLRFRI